jgi:hypothetical protein
MLNVHDRRMKQLEQRVETLMDMLSGNVASSSLPRQANETGSLPLGDMHEMGSLQTSASNQYATPEDSPDQLLANEFATWDPIETGLLKEREASAMLDEFREDYVESFPFVIVEASTNIDALRQGTPFLFLAIMTAMSYKDPTIQSRLAQCFRDQIAARISGCTHKGLEFLQGLLVHAAYYHFVYEPGKQQLALITQLCVATSQDTGFVKTSKNVDAATMVALEAAERRALLGSYYVAAV